MTTWILVIIFMHSSNTVPGFNSLEDCKRAAAQLSTSTVCLEQPGPKKAK